MLLKDVLILKRKEHWEKVAFHWLPSELFNAKTMISFENHSSMLLYVAILTNTIQIKNGIWEEEKEDEKA